MSRLSVTVLMLVASVAVVACADNILKERPAAKAVRATATKPAFAAMGKARGESSVCASYRRQLRLMNLPPSSDPQHYAYCEADSWLVDYDALVGAYSRVFSDVRVLDYDEICARERTIIPSFAREIGWHDYDVPDTRLFLNVSRLA